MKKSIFILLLLTLGILLGTFVMSSAVQDPLANHVYVRVNDTRTLTPVWAPAKQSTDGSQMVVFPTSTYTPTFTKTQTPAHSYTHTMTPTVTSTPTPYDVAVKNGRVFCLTDDVTPVETPYIFTTSTTPVVVAVPTVGTYIDLEGWFVNTGTADMFVTISVGSRVWANFVPARGEIWRNYTARVSGTGVTLTGTGTSGATIRAEISTRYRR